MKDQSRALFNLHTWYIFNSFVLESTPWNESLQSGARMQQPGEIMSKFNRLTIIYCYENYPYEAELSNHYVVTWFLP